ncbi:unnamed protein product [Cunninghamella echinulata]
MPQEGRHTVFKFMLACINGQYEELGMARITFYNSLLNYSNWDDFKDMYQVLFALCKGGRDISGFEKNINKLLITWLDMTLRRIPHYPHRLLLSTHSKPFIINDNQQQQQQQHNSSISSIDTQSHGANIFKSSTINTTNATTKTPSSPMNKKTKPVAIPFLGDILHLLTTIAKFNFAQFEEDEVTQMVIATRQAFYISDHPDDIATCLSFCDVVVRYRFVPFNALKPFLEIMCGAVTLPNDIIMDTSKSYWPIFQNLLRSHCAHNAVLTLCNFLEESLEAGSSAENLAEGAITLLTETAWSNNQQRTSIETYKVPDTVLLLYFLRAVQQGGKKNQVIHACILNSLTILLEQNQHENIGLMEWDIIWDIGDLCSLFVLSIMDDSSKNVVQTQLLPVYSPIHQLSRFLGKIYKLYMSKQYKGPVQRFMQVLFALRRYASESSATILLNYFEAEHFFLPSSENWINLLLEITNTFFLSPPSETTYVIRSRVLKIVTDVCVAVKDFYSEDMYQQIVIPMMNNIAQEKETAIQQKAIDLLVECLSDCQHAELFDTMLEILKQCAKCKCTTFDNTNSGHHQDSTISRSNKPHSSTLRRSLSHSKTKPLQTVTDQSLPRSATATPLLNSTHSASTPPLTIASSSSTTTSSSHGQCTGAHSTCGILDLFEQLLRADTKAAFCVKVYNTILQIVNDSADLLCAFGGPKLLAVDMLLRFRCSPNHRIFIIEKVPNTGENEYVAGIRKIYDEHKIAIQKQRDAESYGTSIAQPSIGKDRYDQPNPFLLSYDEKNTTNDDDDDDDDDDEDEDEEDANETTSNTNNYYVLNINGMVKAYIKILNNSQNWELISFILKRLTWQLATKHMFCGASSCIRRLRRTLVNQISGRNFLKQIINLPPTVKRNDLNVYAYQLLTVLISYRRLFNKHSQDKIVYAFYIGITQVTAATKPCINALNICCHELPLSIAKMLNEILQRMSQIISVASVSVHILEFLSGLARLPNLYANFTGDMYKPVFAIALNYLQHARSVTASGSTANNNNNTTALTNQVSPVSTPGLTISPMFNSPIISNSVPSTPSQQQPHQQQQTSKEGAMPQYVLIMAYLVITVWFTAIPLRERRKHVPFIIQRLVAGNTMDEQTVTCIDMLSRFAFADVSLSPQKTLVSKILMEGSDDSTTTSLTGQNKSTNNGRTWVYGNTLLTLKTAKALGWVEITIRRPSGTVSMMCNIENVIKSDAIDYKTLPALLMMQYQPDLMAVRLLNEADAKQEDLMNANLSNTSTSITMKGSNNKDKHQLTVEGEALGITFDEEEEEGDDNQNEGENEDGDININDDAKENAETDLELVSSENIASPLSTDNNNGSNNNNNNILSPTSPLSSTSNQKVEDNNNVGAKSPPQPNTNTTSSSSSPLLPPGLKTPRLGKTKADIAQEERIHTIVRDILSDQGEHGVSQQSRNILRKMEPSLDPGFLYLQLNNYPDLTNHFEMLPPLADDESTTRAINTLDRIPVVDFHKIGVIYVAKGQTQEVDILANTYGSPAYVKFLNGLGTIERLRGRTGNTGGLDRENDVDGKYAYFWKDDVTEMVFHVATMMPTQLDRDPRCSGKKRHIGNDYVTIVYFDNDDMTVEYAFDTLPGQFNFINIIVTPFSMSTEKLIPSQAIWGEENTFFKVTMQRRHDMPEMGPISETKLISAQSLPGFIRQISLHANIFAQIFHHFGAGGRQEYVSHWKERLRHIRRIKDRILQQQQQQQQLHNQQQQQQLQQQQQQQQQVSSSSSQQQNITASSSNPSSSSNIPNLSSSTANIMNNNVSSAPSSNLPTPNASTTIPMNATKLQIESLLDFTRYT